MLPNRRPDRLVIFGDRDSLTNDTGLCGSMSLNLPGGKQELGCLWDPFRLLGVICDDSEA